MRALSLSGKEDETSPGKGHDSSDYFITANPTQTRKLATVGIVSANTRILHQLVDCLREKWRGAGRLSIT
jgi:hypothetical protein